MRLPMHRLVRTLVPAVVLAAVLFGSGCASDPTVGYSSASTFPKGVTTISVPIIENDTFGRGIEFELTDALIKEIEASTPYRVTGGGRADSILTGRIVDVDLQQLSKSRFTGLSEEEIVSVTIDFEWRDLRSGRTMVRREAFEGHALFVPSAPTGEPIELGQFSVVQRLARDIVAEMRSSW